MPGRGLEGWSSDDYRALALVKVDVTEALLRHPERVRWRALYELTMQLWPQAEPGGLPTPDEVVTP